MIYILMQRHGEDFNADRSLGGLAKVWYHNWRDTVDLFSHDGSHPEEQVAFIKRLVKDKQYQGKLKNELNYVLATNSLTIIYALNNELLRNSKLKVMAYEVVDGKRVRAIHKRWIDESVLGHVSDELHTEMNKLMAKKLKKKKS